MAALVSPKIWRQTNLIGLWRLELNFRNLVPQNLVLVFIVFSNSLFSKLISGILLVLIIVGVGETIY